MAAGDEVEMVIMNWIKKIWVSIFGKKEEAEYSSPINVPTAMSEAGYRGIVELNNKKIYGSKFHLRRAYKNYMARQSRRMNRGR